MGVYLVCEDIHLLIRSHITQAKLKCKTVHLGLGKGIGPSGFHRILGRDDKEGLLKGTEFAIDADLSLCHGLKKGWLGPGWSPIDLIRQQYVGKNRPFMEVKGLIMLIKDGNTEDIWWQKIWCKLDSLKLGINGEGEGLGQCGLAGSRIVFQQDMATAYKACQQLSNGRWLTPHDLFNILSNPLINLFWAQIAHGSRFRSSPRLKKLHRFCGITGALS